MTVSNHEVSHTKPIKYLGILLDENLTYQAEVKSFSRKWLVAKKSQLQYSSVLLNGIVQYLKITLEKQLIWGMKAIFHKNTFESSCDLKIEHKILSVQSLLDLKMNCYFWKWKNQFLPAYTGNEKKNYL